MGTDAEPQRHYFMHIPKTAGMTLFHRLIRCHGDALYPLPPDRGRPEAAIDVDVLVDRFRTSGDRIRVIVGHFPLCIDEVLGVPLTTFTVLRHPVERTLSFLRQRQQRHEQFRGLPLEEIYRDPYLLHGMIHNFMVKVLTMSAGEMRAGVATMVPYDEARLERARHNLEHRVDAFGLQEDLDVFCGELASRYGWDLGDAALYANRTTPGDVSDEFRERIAADNALDVQLFEFATDLVDRRRRLAATSPAAGTGGSS